MLRKTLVTLAISGAMLALAACNTVRGVGKDLQSVANAGEEAIN